MILEQLRKVQGHEVMTGDGVFVCKQMAFAIGDSITYEMPVEVHCPPAQTAQQSRAT